MKKIINNKLYDTSTARLMGKWSNGAIDFTAIDEALYRKKTGEFFLAGEGGPATPYAEPADRGGWRAGSRIMPMTYDEARTWAEEKLEADEYQTIFGDVFEDDGARQMISVTLSAAAIGKLRRESEQTGKPQSAIIEALLMQI